MPGRQWASFYEGHRAETLATYLLSRIATVVPVQREVDVGLDFLCTLLRYEAGALYAGQAFGVQVKSARNPVARYGGLKKKTREWKEFEIDWLYGLDQPMILCVVDLDQSSINLYSTLRIWRLRWMKGKPGEVALVPDEGSSGFRWVHHELFEDQYPCKPLGAPANGQRAGNGFSYKVPLGKPILSISAGDEDTNEYRDRLWSCLNEWIRLSYENIRLFQMRVPYTIEFVSWEPNDVRPIWAMSPYRNPQVDKNIAEILEAMSPALGTLLANLRAQDQSSKWERVAKVAELAKTYGVLDEASKHELHKGSSRNDTVTGP